MKRNDLLIAALAIGVFYLVSKSGKSDDKPKDGAK